MFPNPKPQTNEFPVLDDQVAAVRGPQPPTPVDTSFPSGTSFEPTYAELRLQLAAARRDLADAETDANLLRDRFATTFEQLRVALVKNRAQSGIIRDMLAQMDVPVTLEHTILRHWVDSPNEIAAAQAALSAHRSDGWQVLNFTCLGVDNGDEAPYSVLQVVTLEREVKPAAPLSAAAETVVEDSVANEEFARALGERIIERAQAVHVVQVEPVMQVPPADVLDAR